MDSSSRYVQVEQSRHKKFVKCTGRTFFVLKLSTKNWGCIFGCELTPISMGSDTRKSIAKFRVRPELGCDTGEYGWSYQRCLWEDWLVTVGSTAFLLRFWADALVVSRQDMLSN